MKFLFLESFFGGSHRSFAEGLSAHSRHDIDLITMPGANWKWRMRGASLHFAKKIPPLSDYDGLIVTDLMNLSDFRMFSGNGCPPVLLYVHENQITYPMIQGEKNDLEFGLIDIKNAFVADRILFNSRTHMNDFLSCLPDFLEKMPDSPPRWMVRGIQSKTGFLHPGCPFPAERPPLNEKGDLDPLIIWNHRWGYDKNYGDFFHALDIMIKEGRRFRLALMGENYSRIPEAFQNARERYGERVVQFGYVESRARYMELLLEGAVAVSTARQENFGISMVEAMRCGCIPLLPGRLSYPEVLPVEYHPDFLYRSQRDLIKKLAFYIEHYQEYRLKVESLSEMMGRYAWENIIGAYDRELEELVCQQRQ